MAYKGEYALQWEREERKKERKIYMNVYLG
jgi:hypothetical protein